MSAINHLSVRSLLIFCDSWVRLVLFGRGTGRPAIVERNLQQPLKKSFQSSTFADFANHFYFRIDYLAASTLYQLHLPSLSYSRFAIG